MGVAGHLECGTGTVEATMSPRSKKQPHLRKLGSTRMVLFGMALSAVVTMMWVRMDTRSQLWPKLVDALGVDTLGKGDIHHDVGHHTGHYKERQGNPTQRSNPGESEKADSNNTADSKVLTSASSWSTDDIAMDMGCLGRSQQHKYRKKTYHFPLSEALAGALANYTQMHAQCCVWNESNPAAAAAGGGGCQYVVYYEGYEGLGNRLLSLVTAFAYALVTNRALVIDTTRGHLAQLLCEPFPNYQAREYQEANCTTTTAAPTWRLPEEVAHGVRRQAVPLEAAVRAQFENVTVVRVNLRHDQSAEVQQFFCGEAQRGLREVPWLLWESNQYYVPRLFMVREFWATKLQMWFPDVSRVFTQLGRMLCVPRNAVWRTIQQVHESDMAWGPGTAQVGIQVRRHGVSDNASFSEAVYSRITECVVGAGVVPTTTVMTTTRTTLPQRAKVAVLVTSLQSMYYDKMRERWNNTGTATGGQLKFVMLSNDGTEQFSPEQARKALVEIWLLSLCNDALATSSWSTFGYVAHALAGLRPRILNIRGPNPDLESPALPPCTRGQSPEPCLHYPFTTMAAAAAAAATEGATSHTRWVSRHIRPCQDETNGLQLVA